MKYIVLVVFLTTSMTVFASDNAYWSIVIEVPKYAKSVQREENEKYYTKIVSFEVQDIRPNELVEFYSTFFGGLGWEDPTAAFGNRPEISGDWGGYSMRFSSEGKPEAGYGKSWVSPKVPATGDLSLLLTSYSIDGFSGKATVAIMPNVDMSPLMQIHELLGSDPRNFFVLYEAIGSNPFEIHTISPSNQKVQSKDSIVQEYYRIVERVEAEFAQFGSQYVSK